MAGGTEGMLREGIAMDCSDGYRLSNEVINALRLQSPEGRPAVERKT